ncbi:type II toxin-antitoxin system PemK/MazF family toxin [Desulfosporosinus sp. BICA1-9]|uniref:type II toxin-antitoxin system PemK/MazF family toxin n=1 Tax=Desulfosporosinus sp. BICA1-9 TaxID=1531958 RepID=UPI00054C6082|nr:type II toxin-antitoxin system PemK/MazF family toxin [Desulfosporosinus sp. BICA1-9]KJS46697.1 MAG: toxin MazF [Peptococcaceae bacterium BRH_c23]KJS83805.1 MAG: toxin MazF [Desulfosporosinus sp. BICA1-9]HBW36050.1 type II toxin-antitoxin system PemK/MazF family toxin [Desulfosporosinus sp.]
MGYIPEHGDIVFLEFDPQAGHEQRGKRPALVVSNNTYNQFTNIAMVCPITNTNREFPLHVELDERTKTTGFIMCEQVKALDIQARNVSFQEKAPRDILEEVVDILIGFIEIKNSSGNS